MRSVVAEPPTGESPFRSVDAAEFDRLKRLERETLRSVKSFNAGDRLPREELYRRGRSR